MRRGFTPGTPASSTTNTGPHDIVEILLKVALNTKNQSINQSSNVMVSHVLSIIISKFPSVFCYYYMLLISNPNAICLYRRI
jgi:hypothetical protein